MQYKKIITSCWAAHLVIITLVSVSANAWEVYNEEDQLSDQVHAEEIFLPVHKEEEVTNSRRAAPSIELKRRSHHKNTDENKKTTSILETPTLKGTILDPDVNLSEQKTPKSSPELNPSPSTHNNKARSQEVVRGLAFGEEEDKEDNDTVDKSNRVRQFREKIRDSDDDQAKKAKHTDAKVHKTQRQEIHRQKKVIRLRKIQNPDLVLDFSAEDHQQHQEQQRKQPKLPRQQEQEKSEQEIHQARELLEFEPEVIGEEPDSGVEEIFVREGEQFVGPIGPDCPPDSNTWECLMFAEDLVAVRKDQNLSGASGHRRVKRQSNGNGNGNANGNGNGNANGNGNGNTDSDDLTDASGAGANLYPDTESVATEIPLKKTIVFGNNGNDLNIGAFRRELIQQLREKYADVPGFSQVSVDDITLKPDGTVEANVTLNFQSDPAEYSMLTNDEYLDQLTGELEKVGDTLKNLMVDDRPVLIQTGPEDLRNQASSALSDPCSVTQCPAGFSGCRADPANSRGIQCEHKCILFENTQSCEHGSTCELDPNSEPFCSCTKRWTGKYCQDRVAQSKELDEGEITGVAAGGALLALGVIGTCAWFLLCRRKSKDPIFTHYSDEEGSGRFSNPSSKLSNFVIDRPRISVAPISTFSPNNGSNLSRRSSSDNSGNSMPQRPSRPRYSNA